MNKRIRSLLSRERKNTVDQNRKPTDHVDDVTDPADLDAEIGAHVNPSEENNHQMIEVPENSTEPPARDERMGADNEVLDQDEPPAGSERMGADNEVLDQDEPPAGSERMGADNEVLDEDWISARLAIIEDKIEAVQETINVLIEDREIIEFLKENAQAERTKVQRFEAGYDEQILEKHISRFIRINQNFTEDIDRLENTQLENTRVSNKPAASDLDDKQGTDDGHATSEVLKALKSYKGLVTNALLESGVVAFEPHKGTTSVTDETQVTAFIFSENQDDDAMIADIVAPGYKINEKVLIKSKVKAYTLNEEVSDG